MYLVVIAVLSIVLTFSASPLAWVAQSGPTLAAVAGATLVPPAVAALVRRRVLGWFEHGPGDPGRGQLALRRGMGLVQFLLAAGHVGVLLGTGWLTLCREATGLWFVVPGVLALAPFVLSVVLSWAALYPADRAVRQLAVELYVYQGRPLRRVWSLGEYLVSNLRHQVLFILVPMLLILAARDLVVHYDAALHEATRLEYAGDVLLGLSAVGVAVIAPEILRHVWVTQRLPDGPLRDRLLLLCRRLRLRCREILVWRSGGMIVNAAVMGVVAPLRYVLITDAMLEQMEDVKVEAVFGHEAGHVKRHHILHFLLFALVSGCLVTIFAVRTRGLEPAEYQVATALLGGLLLVKWGLAFGWISRRFERQADLFAVRTLTLGGLPCTLPCALHRPAGDPGGAAAAAALCSSAALVFGLALHDVAVLNGIPPEARSWRHSSIASRSQFVQRLARDPAAAQRFERGVGWIQAGIAAAAVAGTVWAGLEIELWRLLERFGPL